MLLPIPTIDLVKAECEEFDREDELVEQSLALLLRCFPQNSDLRHILLKVVALNKLYTTNILDVNAVARHVHSLSIDGLLSSGSIELVERIAKVEIRGKVRNNFSFASKYCSWHSPSAYPIYDSNVERCLWAYRRQNGFFNFVRAELWAYESFFRIICDFRDHYGLQSLTFKQLDKFLYRLGATLGS